MSNSNKLNFGAKSFSCLSDTEKIEPAENSELPHKKQSFEKNDIELDALSKVKLDPAVLEAKVTLNVLPSTVDYGSQFFLNEQVTHKEIPKLKMSFEDSLLSMHKKEQLKLTSQQCALLMVFAQNLKNQSVSSQTCNQCGLCKNNGHSVMWYKSHILKDKRGLVQCPILRAFTCPICGETGDRAHTAKYCPYKE